MSENIYTAINKAMQDVGYVQKEKTQGLRYSYAGEAALIAAIRPAMVAQQITMGVVSYDLRVNETYTTSSGTEMNHYIVEAIVRFTHAPSETHLDVAALGEGADVSDKGINKAMTGAYKYALRQTFVIETGDDPDREPSEKQQRAAKPGLVWPRAYVEAMMEMPGMQHHKHAVNLLNLLYNASGWNVPATSPDQFVDLAEIYRTIREQYDDVSAEKAAQAAFESWTLQYA